MSQIDEYEIARRRLIQHAGLPVNENESELPNESLSFELYLADRERTCPNLALLDDVLSCLSVLNRYFNGPDPNVRSPGPRTNPIPDTVAYSVACIVASSMGYYRKWAADRTLSDDVLSALLIGIHKITFCWMQVLAGDITDLAEGFE